MLQGDKITFVAVDTVQNIQLGARQTPEFEIF